MQFTGERLILTPVSGWFWDQLALEHVARYLFARQFAEDRVVLDAACGTGYGANLLGHVAKSVTGVDISPDAVAFADANWGSGNVHFVAGDVNAMPLESGSIDLVVSFETIEHVHEPKAFADEVHRVLRSGGLFIVSTPNRDVYNWADHQSDGGNHFHLAEMTPDQFIALMTAHFDVRQVFGQRCVRHYQATATSRAEPQRSPWQAASRRIVKSLTAPILNHPWVAPRAVPMLRSLVPRPYTEEPWKYVIAVCQKR